jgi:hypothetical protein
MAINQRERLLIGAVLGCFALYAADAFAIEPMIAAWKANTTKIERLQQDIKDGTMITEPKRKEAILAKWNDMREHSLPADQAAAGTVVLNAVGNWAIASRLNVTGVKSRWTIDPNAKTTRGAPEDRLEVRVSAEGNLSSVTRFLYELERDKLAVRDADVEIRSRDDHGTQLLLDVRFTALILPEEKKK